MLALLEIFAIFILPILLWKFGIVPMKYLWWTLTGMVLLTTAVVISERWTLQMLGIRTDNFKSTLWPYLIFTLFGAAVIFMFKNIKHKKVVNYWRQDFHFIAGGFLLISVFQEFVYRGFLMPKLEMLFSSVMVVLITNAFLFMLPHLIYSEPFFHGAFAFFAGLAFAAIYHFYPNLMLISFSHAALNFTVCLFGFFVLPKNQETTKTYGAACQ